MSGAADGPCAKFGDVAIRRGLVTRERVEECLELQRRLREQGIAKSLGAVIHDKGYLSLVEVGQVLREVTGAATASPVPGYEILSRTGQGANGVVYRARQQSLGRIVAIKVISPEFAKSRERLERFRREARTAALLDHPNIVRALDVGEAYGYHYFIMEHVDGETASALLERRGALPETLVLSIGAQIADALAYAWRHKVVHRDVKPANIIVTRDLVAKLCDLGLAKCVVEDQGLTKGVILGTPFYVSPEQVRGETLDARSDVYSLGVTLFHLLVGAPPFGGKSAVEVMRRHLHDPPPSVRALVAGISARTNDLIRCLLAKRREDRPEDPARAARVMRAIAAGLASLEPASVQPPRAL